MTPRRLFAPWQICAMVAWGLVMLAAWMGWLALYGWRFDGCTAHVFLAWVLVAFAGNALIGVWETRP